MRGRRRNTYLIWVQEEDFSPVKRRAFILADSFKEVYPKAQKAGITNIADVWRVNSWEIALTEKQTNKLNRVGILMI